MPLNVRFRERMVGRIGEIPDAHVDLPDRSSCRGDDLVRAAHMPSEAATAQVLELDGLVLQVDARVDGRDGMRSTIVEGEVSGVGDGVDGPVVAGFADLLFRTRRGERRMYYRLLVGGPARDGRDGWALIEGVKVVRSSRWLAWRQTTTLFTRVATIGPDVAREAVVRLDREIRGARTVAAGILHVLPGDLARQAASMRGPVPLFLAAFFARLARR